ncbi:MAG: shikimate dehydrogenase [Paracoccaceae bacterium]
MSSSNSIPLAGVIGSPVDHSRSPALHAHWLRRYGIRGYYIPMDIDHTNLGDAIRAMPKLGFVGANVTVPHKEAVLDLADIITDRAALIGAANTLIFRPDGKIHADNTDGYGFIENLRQGAPGWDPKSGPAAVFGAGGAARAVLASLVDVGVPEIRLSNRTKARADALRAEFGSKIKIYDWVQAGNMLDQAALVVNASVLGMTGKPEMRLPLDAMSKTAVVSDLVYTPLDTGLLQHACKLGCTTVDGVGMLIYQAAPAFERWFGVRPEVDEETRQIVLGL